jgi:hypothetical protein
MAPFKVSAGLREHEVVNLRWITRETMSTGFTPGAKLLDRTSPWRTVFGAPMTHPTSNQCCGPSRNLSSSTVDVPQIVNYWPVTFIYRLYLRL